MLGTDARPEQSWRWNRSSSGQALAHSVYIVAVRSAQGNFGTSTYYHTGVLDILLRRASVTLFLGGISLIISAVLGITLGVLSVLKQDTWVETSINRLATFGISIPNFWIAILLIFIFAQQLQLLPVQGYTALSQDWQQGLRQLILPCITIAFQPTAAIIRQTRAGLLDTAQQDYILHRVRQGAEPSASGQAAHAEKCHDPGTHRHQHEYCKNPGRIGNRGGDIQHPRYGAADDQRRVQSGYSPDSGKHYCGFFCGFGGSCCLPIWHTAW